MQSQSRGPTGEQTATASSDAPAHEVRMRTVAALADAGTALSVSDLALELDGADGPDDVDADRLRRLRIGLYHRHLPKLAAAGVVDFDPERQSAVIAVDPDSEDLEAAVRWS